MGSLFQSTLSTQQSVGTQFRSAAFSHFLGMDTCHNLQVLCNSLLHFLPCIGCCFQVVTAVITNSVDNLQILMLHYQRPQITLPPPCSWMSRRAYQVFQGKQHCHHQCLPQSHISLPLKICSL